MNPVIKIMVALFGAVAVVLPTIAPGAHWLVPVLTVIMALSAGLHALEVGVLATVRAAQTGRAPTLPVGTPGRTPPPASGA